MIIIWPYDHLANLQKNDDNSVPADRYAQGPGSGRTPTIGTGLPCRTSGHTHAQQMDLWCSRRTPLQSSQAAACIPWPGRGRWQRDVPAPPQAPAADAGQGCRCGCWGWVVPRGWVAVGGGWGRRWCMRHAPRPPSGRSQRRCVWMGALQPSRSEARVALPLPRRESTSAWVRPA